MDIASLRQVDEFQWAIPLRAGETRAPALLFGSRALVEAMDEKVREQLLHVAALPGLVGAAMAMPDAHWGYGFPIGGVAAFDAEQGGVVSAGGVGFDISCGIRCLRTGLSVDDVRRRALPLADDLAAQVPAGVGEEGRIRLDPGELRAMLEGGARWAVEQGYGPAADLEYVEEGGCMRSAVAANVSDVARRRQAGEMGTLGSGNHYLEVQEIESILEEEAARAFGLRAGEVVVSIHTGSRGLGHQVGTDALLDLARHPPRGFAAPSDRELACAPIHSLPGGRYLGAMNAAINCALANRQMVAHLARRVLLHHFPAAVIETLFDVSHNTCKAERHLVDGRARLLHVHRKGATRALGPGHPSLPARYAPVGQPVIIGGTMGTASWIMAGTSSGEERALSSASHGAGRAMSRHAALRKFEGRQVTEALRGRGIVVRSRTLRGVAEEAPGAYKDVDEVAASTEGAGLARRVARLRPVVCVKG